MAAATVTATEWGYYVTGGTDTTTINSGTLKVRSIAFAGNADNATAALTTVRGEAAVSVYKFKTDGNDLDCSGTHAYFDGVKMTGLAVTLSNAGDFLYVFVE